MPINLNITTLKKPVVRAFQGAIAAFGAPFGWLGIRWLEGTELYIELSDNSGLYSYMLLGTIATFSMFGWYVGSKEQHLTKLALRDALTGVFNVRFFRERLQEEVLFAQRNDTPLTLISFDLDHFKRVNDTYGHSVGDDVLTAICQAAIKVVRQYEVLARVGGEEFSVLLPQCTTEYGVITAERLREKIAGVKVKLDNGKKVSVTVSLGVAGLGEADDAKSLYDKADRALYLAKENGRNRVEVL